MEFDIFQVQLFIPFSLCLVDGFTLCVGRVVRDFASLSISIGYLSRAHVDFSRNFRELNEIHVSTISPISSCFKQPN